MSVKINNFLNQNENLEILEQKGIFTIFQHAEDLSTSPKTAQTNWFMAQTGCTRKQCMIALRDNAVRLKPGAMQFMTGDVQQTTGVTGMGDFLGKAITSKMTGNAPIKPLYKGTGIIVTEPTFGFFLIENNADWDGGLVMDDGMFICCDDELKDDIQMRNNFGSAVAGGEGLFNLKLVGNGYSVLRSPNPRAELYEIILNNDCVKIDGNNAICWSGSLQFTVERSGRSLVGSAASGEGLVNVYRGTGRILMMPLR